MELNLFSFIIVSLHTLTTTSNFVYSSALSIDKEVNEANSTVKLNITEVKEPDLEEQEKEDKLGDYEIKVKVPKDEEIVNSDGKDTYKLPGVPLSILAQLPELDPCMKPPVCALESWPWCEVVNGTVRCICILKYYRSPPICKPTCTIDSECNADMKCIYSRCRDPCPRTCGINARCDVINHEPHCSCPSDFSGNPYISCHNMHQVPLRIRTPCMPTPCGPNSQCKEINGIAVCSCRPNRIGSPPNCTQKCTNNSECNEVMACINNRCSDPCPICGNDASCEVHKHIPYCSCLTQKAPHPHIVNCQVIHQAMDPTFGYKQYPIMGPKFDPTKGAPWLGLKTERDFLEWKKEHRWPYNIPLAPYCIANCILSAASGPDCPLGYDCFNKKCVKIDSDHDND